MIVWWHLSWLSGDTSLRHGSPIIDCLFAQTIQWDQNKSHLPALIPVCFMVFFFPKRHKKVGILLTAPMTSWGFGASSLCLSLRCHGNNLLMCFDLGGLWPWWALTLVVVETPKLWTLRLSVSGCSSQFQLVQVKVKVRGCQPIVWLGRPFFLMNTYQVMCSRVLYRVFVLSLF